MSPEPNPNEEILAVIREALAEFGGRVETLRAEGIELGGLLEDAARLAAALEAGTEEPQDVEAFMAKLIALKEEVGQTRHLQRQAEAVKAISALPAIVEGVERGVESLRAHGGAVELRSAADMEASLARLRADLAAGRLSADALQDIKLTMEVQLAELDRRDNLAWATWGLYWEKAPPERWAMLSTEQREKCEGLLEQWRAKRVGILGMLPLEDRRRLEALRYEDFERMGGSEP
jgi:hypothetical protein